MPTLQVTTTESKSVWKSPDGQREIFEVTFDYEGQPMKAKTFSSDIPVVGWTGTVETWEKEGKQGTETFVKQPPKEGGGYSSSSAGSGSRSPGAKPSFDQFTMYLSYAKDLVVALVSTTGYTPEALDELLQATINGGHTLYDNRPGAEGSKPEAAEAVTKSDKVVEVPDDQAPINLDALDAIFPDKDKDDVK